MIVILGTIMIACILIAFWCGIDYQRDVEEARRWELEDENQALRALLDEETR